MYSISSNWASPARKIARLSFDLATPKRLELVRAIRRNRPASVSQLAQLVGRDFKNVHADVQTLAQYGLVSLTTPKAGRRTTVPRVAFSVLEFRIAV